MAQSLHAAFGYASAYPRQVGRWLRESQFLVVVSVPDESGLLALALRSSATGLPHCLWSEPDLDGQATAIALAPGPVAKRLCANLPLAGREVVYS